MSKYRELKEENMALGVLNDELIRINFDLREENKNLKSDLAFNKVMLDNVKAEYKSLQEIIKKFEEEN